MWGLCPRTPGIYRIEPIPEIELTAGAQLCGEPQSDLGPEAALSLLPAEAYPPLRPLRTTEEAARAANVTFKTILRWQKEPEFDAAFRAAKRAAFGQSIGRLHYLSSGAVSTLGKVMPDAATPRLRKSELRTAS